jgi:superfamily II DNA/RNA helicase
MGFTQPTPIQGATIPVALLGKDICACAATGTGKTQCNLLNCIHMSFFSSQEKLLLSSFLFLSVFSSVLVKRLLPESLF